MEGGSVKATEGYPYLDDFLTYTFDMSLSKDAKENAATLAIIDSCYSGGLEHEFIFDQEYVEGVACTDEVDRAIIEELHHAGPYGILPRDVASRLKEYQLSLGM